MGSGRRIFKGMQCIVMAKAEDQESGYMNHSLRH